MSTIIVYVHGLWFTGLEATYLRRELARELLAEDRNFPYHSMSATISESAAELGEFVAACCAGENGAADTLHLVGHSMGGLVILKLCENPPPLPPGRILLLGPPAQGSRAALGLARLPFGRNLLGRGIEEAVLDAAARGCATPRRWHGPRELGIIAGDTAFGLGGLVAQFDGPNDGVVLVEETRLAGASDHLVLPVNHAGMLFSLEVVRQGAEFLRAGKFVR